MVDLRQRNNMIWLVFLEEEISFFKSEVELIYNVVFQVYSKVIHIYIHTNIYRFIYIQIYISTSIHIETHRHMCVYI